MTLGISQMSRVFGVSLRTLRFYENRGLIKPRREGNARYNRASDRIRMEMVLKGKKLGFTLIRNPRPDRRQRGDRNDGSRRSAESATDRDPELQNQFAYASDELRQRALNLDALRAELAFISAGHDAVVTSLPWRMIRKIGRMGLGTGLKLSPEVSS
jgi:DNA-binding transcriptional MerR regulator